MVVLIFLAMVVEIICVRLASGSMDRDRIRAYIESQAGRLLDCNWSPFGRGWFGSKEERIYEITYLDREGNRHRATCKTSLLSGVYFTEDAIEERAERFEAPPARESELARLRRENEELKRRLGE